MRLNDGGVMRRYTPGAEVEGDAAAFAVKNGYGKEVVAQKAKRAPANKAKPEPKNKS